MSTVAGNANAIGYISLGSLNDSVKAVNVDGVEATVDNIKSGSYKVSRPFNIATKDDLALGIINMVFESIGMLAVFAARSKNTRDIVLTGNLSKMPQAKPIFDILSNMFDMNFVIPEYSEFATVIGAALADFK